MPRTKHIYWISLKELKTSGLATRLHSTSTDPLDGDLIQLQIENKKLKHRLQIINKVVFEFL